MPSDTSLNTLTYLTHDMSEPQVHEFAGGTAAVFTTRCPGKETVNEDAAAVVACDEQRGILAVADGFGGQPSGERAAEAAMRALIDAVDQSGATGQDLRDAVLNGFERANAAVRSLGVGAATTMAVVEVNISQIRPYHVGDSGILVVGQRGAVRLKTVSHSPVGYGVEAGLLKAGEAMHHQDRHLVSNMVGTPQMRIDVGPVLTLRPRDTVVVASDGLFDNLRVDEVVEMVRKGPLSGAAGALVGACLDRMTSPRNGVPSKRDDLTVILLRLL